MRHSPSPDYFKLVGRFIERFFGGSEAKLSLQRWWKTPRVVRGKTLPQFVYHPLGNKVTQSILTEHFYLSPLDKGGFFQGSLGVIPLSPAGDLNFVCIDVDWHEGKTDLKKKAYERILPKLDEYGLNYLIEHGGNLVDGEYDRCHIWIPLKSSPKVARIVFKQLFEEAGCNMTSEFDEVFGVTKLSNLIRLPLGPHLSREAKRFPIEIGGELTDNPIDFIRWWLDTPYPKEEDLLKIIKPEFMEQERREAQTPTFRDKKGEFFRYRDLNLPLPFPVPSFVEPMAKNCQALNSLLHTVKEEEMIKLPGDQHHIAGLWLNRLAGFNDVKVFRKTKQATTEGADWFQELLDKYRIRDVGDHNWDSNQEEIARSPDKFISRCETWEAKFDRCKGCPFRGNISSPRAFAYGIPISREKVGEVPLVTPEYIRKEVFPQIKSYILEAAKDRRRENILLGTYPNSGKSWLVSEMTAELVKMGKKVLIASPYVKLALEHKERLEKMGTPSFLLTSHKSIFANKEKFGGFDCPSYNEIQESLEIGISGADFKKDYCKGCPFFEQCYYPNQYSQLLNDQPQVVIVQHAHLQCQEIVYDLVKMKFDVLFIDESFIDITYSALPIRPQAVEILKEFDYIWCSRLVEWLSFKSNPRGKIFPNEKQLREVREAFIKAREKWLVPDYVRYFNQGRGVVPEVGIEVIYELPAIPIKVFTDGTPPEDLIKLLTGIEKLTVIGKEYVQDIKAIHPDNEIIQVLDSSASWTSLNQGNKFELIMLKIAELIELIYKEEKVLISVSSYRMMERVEQFFKEHVEDFPTARSRVFISLLDKGTNAFEDYDVQFLLGGVYFTGYDYAKSVYRYKSVGNHFLFKKDFLPLSNIYPYETNLMSSSSLEGAPTGHRGSSSIQEEPIKRIEYPGEILEYKDFRTLIPDDKWELMVYNYNVANTQQAIRLRFKPDKKRIVWVLNNFNMNCVITKNILIKEFIKPIDFEL